jgi:hypothetical protein
MPGRMLATAAADSSYFYCARLLPIKVQGLAVQAMASRGGDVLAPILLEIHSTSILRVSE